MQKIKWIFGLIVILGFNLHAQQQGNRQAKDEQQSTNINTQEADNVNNSAGNTVSAADTSAVSDANNHNNGNQGNGVRSERASNAPAVTQTTSSSSGSPAVLSNADGQGRDGTNNVQRATMNMAGAPAKNIRINEKSANTDNEMKDRQDYEQDKESSARRQNRSSNANPSAGGSGEINDNSRRENNALSDQNLSAKDKKLSDKSEDKKPMRKVRKKKEKG